MLRIYCGHLSSKMGPSGGWFGGNYGPQMWLLHLALLFLCSFALVVCVFLWGALSFCFIAFLLPFCLFCFLGVFFGFLGGFFVFFVFLFFPPSHVRSSCHKPDFSKTYI